MASFTASTPTSSVTRAALVHKPSVGAPSSTILALPSIGNKGKLRCSMEAKPPMKESNSNIGMSASLVAAALAATMSSPAAMALVDDRLSTEGTGLPFGLSNNLLGWILLGVFALIWTFYFTYTSGLEEDEESALLSACGSLPFRAAKADEPISLKLKHCCRVKDEFNIAECPV
ncbi:hypothetical protein ACLB2K_010691 [Fragaria x ananassa]